MSNNLMTQKTNEPSINIFDKDIFTSCMQISSLMAKSKLIPTHLQGKQEDCFVIVQQSYRWKMDPFAVAQCTSVVHGKLCYEGKLVAAVVDALAGVKLSYKYAGSGDNRSVTVSGLRKGDSEPCVLTIVLKDVKTDNLHWRKSSDQMLSYKGARDWARRYEAATLLGIYTKDEMQDAPIRDVTPRDNSDIEESFKNQTKESSFLKDIAAVTSKQDEEKQDVKNPDNDESGSFMDVEEKFKDDLEEKMIKALDLNDLDKIAGDHKQHIDSLDDKWQKQLRKTYSDRKKELKQTD